ncbi:hypothetical protein BT96DRAFT_157304 [Gymnopus androsaceus JB14]|uniref:Uncharacterized protein n=1 Tax=Gymnopus androsaceus JB14 TaxID=1447944 RepID=A0A6A4HC15_9AGAR|nr:hypothetical protein BT96DRAFT_157304 [Gymnopus androsaceus JB14]
MPHPASRYTIAPKSTPMSELIRRVNSMPNSRFKSPVVKGAGCGRAGAGANANADEGASGSGGLTAYSLYLKSSGSFLSLIAPLHPNRRSPLAVSPPPPPRRKTRKEMEWEKKDPEEKEELEERREEVISSVGGVSEWLALGEQRRMMKRMKRNRELRLGRRNSALDFVSSLDYLQHQYG